MTEWPPLVLDGVEELDLPPPGPPLVVRDPFREADEPDPFLARLEVVLRSAECSVRGTGAEPIGSSAARLRGRAARGGGRSARRPPSSIPLSPQLGQPGYHLVDLEAPRRRGLLDRLLDEDHLRRLDALEQLVQQGCAYDRFGLSPRAVRAAFPIVLALHRAWFRVRSVGVENIPAEGGAVLAANHGGLLPFDGAMIAADVLLHTDPPRLARAIVDRWAGTLPWVNVFFARVGQVVGTRENFTGLLADQQLVLVFPEGMSGAIKSIGERHRLQRFHVGFVEEALRAQVPIVPVAVVGSDDQTPILHDVKPLARLLGLPAFPITPTFPWLGPLGLLPYPVSYQIVYGKPLCFHERFGPRDADDARLVRYLASQVRTSMQRLLDEHA